MRLKILEKIFIENKYAFFIAILFIFLCGYIVFSSFGNETIQSVNTTLVTNKVIVLDAGHGAPDLRSNRI